MMADLRSDRLESFGFELIAFCVNNEAIISKIAKQSCLSKDANGVFLIPAYRKDYIQNEIPRYYKDILSLL